MNQALKTIGYARWSISSDAESTRKAYEAVIVGSQEECGCADCRNFAVHRDSIYLKGVLAFFDEPGINPNLEAEIYHMARLQSGEHLYGGWFHFVGSILSGGDAAKQVTENIWQPDLEQESEKFALGFSWRLGLVRESFKLFPLVQLEFTVKLPWVLDERNLSKLNTK